MPFRDSSVDVRAILPFRDPEAQNVGGQIVLREDGMVQFVPSPTLSAELEQLVTRVDAGTLKWGSSLVVGFAATGAALFWRSRRSPAYALFGLSAATGLGAFAARQYLRTLEAWIRTPMPRRQVQISHETADGGLRVRLNGGGVRQLIATIRPTEFDSAEADAFIRALASFDAPA